MSPLIYGNGIHDGRGRRQLLLQRELGRRGAAAAMPFRSFVGPRLYRQRPQNETPAS